MYYILSLFVVFSVSAQKASTNKTTDLATDLTNKVEASKVEPVKQAPKNVEKIEVTGSYIKRIDVEGPSPLVIIDKEEFAKTGNNSVADLLRESAYFEAAYKGNPVGGSYDGHARFHGQHAGNTLYLLNGLRLPKENGTFYTSISYIPTSVIERVEMMKDGAGALYGSDAVAGVVNFVTKKEFDGGSVDTQYNIAETGLGQEQNYSASYGKTFSKGSVLGVVQYSKMSPFLTKDLGSYNTRKNVGASEVTATTVTAPHQNPKERDVKSSFGGSDCSSGKGCETDYLQYKQAQSEVEEINALMTARYEINDDIEVSVLGLYGRKANMGETGPRSLEFDVGAGGFSNAAFKSSVLKPNMNLKNSLSVTALSADQLGPNIQEKLTDTINTQAQVRGYIGDSWDWRWQTGYTYQKADTRSVSGDANLDLVKQNFLRASNINSFNNSLSATAINPTRRYRGQMLNTKLISAGELVNWGAGAISMAVGGELEYETFLYDHDKEITSGVAASGKGQNFNGFRQNTAGFIELSANPLSSLELQLAGRVDNYNDVGSSVNPKFALAYRPHRTTLIRASVGTSFKPPGVADMFQPTKIERYSFIDEKTKKEYVNQSVEIVANDKISFETGTHYNIGAVIQPTKSFAITLDQWNFEGKGAISNMRASDLTIYEARGGIENLRKLGADIVRDGQGNITKISVPNVFNRAEKALRGVDLAFNYGGNARMFNVPFKVKMNTTFTHIFERREKTFQWTGWEDGNLYGSQNTTAISISTLHNFYRLGVRTLVNGDRSSQRQGREWDFPTYAEVDLTYTYSADWGGKITAGVKNLLDTTPYVNMTRSVVDYSTTSSMFSPLKRRFFAGYSQTF